MRVKYPPFCPDPGAAVDIWFLVKGNESQNALFALLSVTEMNLLS